jgi:hypothetical protein
MAFPHRVTRFVCALPLVRSVGSMGEMLVSVKVIRAGALPLESSSSVPDSEVQCRARAKG